MSFIVYMYLKENLVITWWFPKSWFSQTFTGQSPYTLWNLLQNLYNRITDWFKFLMSGNIWIGTFYYIKIPLCRIVLHWNGFNFKYFVTGNLNVSWYLTCLYCHILLTFAKNICSITYEVRDKVKWVCVLIIVAAYRLVCFHLSVKFFSCSLLNCHIPNSNVKWIDCNCNLFNLQELYADRNLWLIIFIFFFFWKIVLNVTIKGQCSIVYWKPIICPPATLWLIVWILVMQKVLCNKVYWWQHCFR